jgi:carboxyl-terminal processing protease
MRYLLFLLACASGASTQAPSELGASPHHVAVAGLVASHLERYHYDGRPIDDAVSQRWLDMYLEALDYNRLIFLDSDIAEFRAAHATHLDEDIFSRRSTLGPAFAIHARYRSRVNERVEDALKVLLSPIDLTDEETWMPDREDADWPASRDQARELWRLRIEEQVLRAELDGTERDKAIKTMRERYERLRKSVGDSASNDVLEVYLGALAGSFDPHSAWFKPATRDNFEIEMSKSLEGIGARLRTVDEHTEIVNLVPGGPAQMDGQLKAGDKIVAVAQGRKNPVDVVGLRIDDVVKIIRGAKGTVVRLTIIPVDDPATTKIIALTRDEVVIEEQRAEVKLHDVERDGRTLKVAVLDVPSFYQDMDARKNDKDFVSTTRDVRRLLDEVGEVDGLVVDLRYNGGGSLDEAVQLTGLFLPSATIVQVRDQDGELSTLADPDPKQVYDGPLTVLVSPVSASASEIFAGAIQDFGRGVVVGAEATHGKGTVQAVIGLDLPLRQHLRTAPAHAGGALKLTTQKFYRVSGGSTQHRGVRSDVVIPSVYDGVDIGEATLDNALPWDEIGAAMYAPVGDPNAALPGMKERSRARIDATPAFQWMAEDRAWREEGDDEAVSLHFETRKAEADARKAVLDARPELPEDADAVLDEALAITADWVEQQSAT